MPGLRLRWTVRPPFDERGVGSDEICLRRGFQLGRDDFPHEDRVRPVAEWRGRRVAGGRWRQDGGTR